MKRSAFYLLTAFVFVLLFFVLPPTKVTAAPLSESDRWCGTGSAPNYGFDTRGYTLTQPYWVVSNGFISEQTQMAVEPMLDQLKAEELSETMILLLPADQIGDAPTCAGHFGRYMKLGLVSGPHKDRGMVWLFVINSDGSLAEIRYGIGYGLPALTAPGLGNLKRVGTDTYAATKSVDEAVIAVVTGYDQYVRAIYGVRDQPAEQTPQSAEVAVAETSPLLIIGFVVVVSFILIGGFSLLGGGGNQSLESDVVTFPENYLEEDDEVESKKKRRSIKNKKTKKKEPRTTKTRSASRRKSRSEETSTYRPSHDSDDDTPSYRSEPVSMPSIDIPSIDIGGGSGGFGRTG